MSDDFQTAFSSVLETKEEEANGNTPPPAEPKQVEQEETRPDPIGSLEEKQAEARAKWKYEKRIKELEQQLASKEKAIDPNTDNPLRELKKIKGWSHDEIVDKALEVLEDEGMSKEEAKKEVKEMSYEEIVAKVKEELKNETEKQTLEIQEKQRIEKAVTEFKGNIKKFSEENAEKYPLVGALGVTDNVYSMIEQDYLSKVEEFGEDFALKNMMKIDDAVKKVNERLASEIKSALKSDHVRNFLSLAIKEASGATKSQSEDEFQLEDEFATLTNDSYKKVTDPKDVREMSNEEALADAFKYL